MKKSLLALAVLAASGAAFAQSSVTLYGRVDLGLSKTTGASAVMADGSAVGGGASRIGLSGTEDLGGGLKAGFVVETQVSADANSLATTFGNRNSYIDVIGGFGAVRLGRHLNPAIQFAGNWHAFGTDYGSASALYNVDGVRYNNGISYLGAFGPVSVQLSTAMKEADTYGVAGTKANAAGDAIVPAAGTAAVKNPLAALVRYNAGPIDAGLAITKSGKAGASKLLTQVGFNYDAKVVKVLVAFEQDGNQAKKNAYSVGIQAPVGAAKIMANYGKDDSSNTKQFAVGANYNLSKRTGVYGVLAQRKVGSAAAANQVTLGVAHTF